MDPAIVSRILTASVVGIAFAALGFGLAWLVQRHARGAAPGPAEPGLGVVLGERRGLADRLWVGPVVLGLVAVVTHQLVLRSDDGEMPSLVPGASFLTWWPTIALVAMGLGVSTALVDLNGWVRWPARLALLAGVAFASARGLVTNRWKLGAGDEQFADWGTIGGVLLGFALLAWAMVAGLERSARPVTSQSSSVAYGRSAGWAGVLGGLVVTVATSQVLIIGYKVQSPAFVVTGLAAALGVALGLSLLKPRLTLAHGTMTTLGVLLSVTLLQATLYGQAKEQHAAMYVGLLLLGAWGPALVDALNLPLRGWVLGLVRAGATAPALAAVGAAVVISPPPV
jgi:hypothetical protein